jgi:hypothetical protein
MKFPAATAVLLGWSFCAVAATPQAPQSVTASYDVYMNGAHVAVMNETFQAHGGTYRIVSESAPVGVLARLQPPATVVSTGKLTADGLRPERFKGRRIGIGEVSAEFDWADARLSFTRDGRTDTVALPRGTQDRLSIMYQFMFYAYARRSHLELAMTDGRRLAQYQYAVTPDEIDTPLGRMATLHLVKQAEHDGNTNEVWLARDRRYLPVKMVIRESNGMRYEQVATRIEIRNPPR